MIMPIKKMVARQIIIITLRAPRSSFGIVLVKTRKDCTKNITGAKKFLPAARFAIIL